MTAIEDYARVEIYLSMEGIFGISNLMVVNLGFIQRVRVDLEFSLKILSFLSFLSTEASVFFVTSSQTFFLMSPTEAGEFRSHPRENHHNHESDISETNVLPSLPPFPLKHFYLMEKAE